jgi:hypothetical protein
MLTGDLPTRPDYFRDEWIATGWARLRSANWPRYEILPRLRSPNCNRPVRLYLTQDRQRNSRQLIFLVRFISRSLGSSHRGGAHFGS